MSITAVEPVILRLDTVDATRADGTQDAFLVRVRTDEGLIGVGEADGSPYVTRTMIEMPSSHALARRLAELLVARIRSAWTGSGSECGGAPTTTAGLGAAVHAISAIDIALSDIAGQAAGLPVSQLLGGRRSDAVAVYASEVMPDTPAEVRAIAESAVSDGYMYPNTASRAASGVALRSFSPTTTPSSTSQSTRCVNAASNTIASSGPITELGNFANTNGLAGRSRPASRIWSR
jgi:L-alanine-DL-glutamate epimerase-like enolase superfamily enzyme